MNTILNSRADLDALVFAPDRLATALAQINQSRAHGDATLLRFGFADSAELEAYGLAAGVTLEAPAPYVPVEPTPDLAATQRAYDAATEALLDQRAASWGYRSMERAAGYAQSTNPQWAGEAGALIAHRDAVWLAGYAIASAVLAGERTVPVLADYLAELPAMPARPAV